MPADPRRGFFKLGAARRRRSLMLLALLALGTAAVVAWTMRGPAPTPTAELAASGALEKGLPTWFIVASMMTVVGVFGALSLRRRRIAQTPDPVSPAAQMCPTCKMSFPPGKGFCPNDGNALVRMVSSMAPRGKIGGVSPTCTQGFDPGVQKCPVDGDTLIPAPVFQTAYPGNCGHDAGEKICPQCGTRTRPPSRFCETDGTELRPLH